MLVSLQEQIESIIKKSLEDSYKVSKNCPSIELETPNDKQHGEYACNIAMRLAKELKKPPLEIAQKLSESISALISENSLKSKIQKVDVKKPGFINFYLTHQALYEVLYEVFKEGDNYGRSNYGQKEKWQIEFVSANPTGPLSVAHARQAAVGDALVNILNFVGFDVQKEYYVNDEGNQINLLGASVKIRAQEILSKTPKDSLLGDDHYKGEYLKEIAQAYIEKENIKSEDDLEGKSEHIAHFAVNCLMGIIQQDLKDFGVQFDIWSHQSQIATQKSIEAILDFLGEKGFMYEKEGALWFQSTTFGDDKDRVLEKSDGSYTYLTPDIVYHKDKFARGFKKIVNIWGPDHHGYIPRIKAAAEALGHDRDDVEVLIVQLATIYRDGKPVSMSTRQGQYISLREVIDEVGVDAARFFFLMRRINQHLDFDLELAKKETSENPVYYIQYAHARIHSIIKKAKESDLKAASSNFECLKEEEEMDLVKKIGQFSHCLGCCGEQLDPYGLVNYLQELASLFHKFYDKHQVVGEDQKLSCERLALIDATRIVLANGLRLIGVGTPEKM